MLTNYSDFVRYTNLLLDPNLNLVATARKLATLYPQTFMEVAVVDDPKMVEIEELLRQGPVTNFIAAIKLHRQHYNTGLKDARDACEAIREAQGYIKPAYVAPTFGDERDDWA